MESLTGVKNVVAEIIQVNKTQTKISVFGGRNNDKNLIYNIISSDTYGCMIMPPFSEYRNVDIYSDDDDQTHIYRIIIKKLLFSNHGTIYRVDDNEMIEVGEINSGVVPCLVNTVCNFENTSTVISGTTCQRAFWIPFSKNRVDVSFELPGDGYIKRTGNHMPIMKIYCKPDEAVNLDPLAYNIRFPENSSMQEKLSSIILSVFIDTTIFGNGLFYSETFN